MFYVILKRMKLFTTDFRSLFGAEIESTQKNLPRSQHLYMKYHSTAM